MFSFLRKVGRGVSLRASELESNAEPVIQEPKREKKAEEPPFPILLLGTPGSGKSSLVKALRMTSSEYREDQFAQEMASERGYLQYDLLCGIVKVMARMLSYQDEDRYKLTDREFDAYKEGKKLIETIQANGAIKSVESDTNFTSVRENVLPFENRHWRTLESFTGKDSFARILGERFIPESELKNMEGRPLKLTDGFVNFFVGNQDTRAAVWNQIVTGGMALQHHTCLPLRNPNGGLFVKSIVKPLKRQETKAAFAFTEFPGRLESLTDILRNLKNEATDESLFDCIVLVLSSADFDAFVETDNGPELVNDYLFNLLSDVKDILGKLSIYMIMTKDIILFEKIRVYREQGILENQLRKGNIQVDDLDEEVIAEHIATTLEEKLTAIWCPDTSRRSNVSVKRFPRSFMINSFDEPDVAEILDEIYKIVEPDMMY